MKIRKATLYDTKGICRIYNYYVGKQLLPFETVAVSGTEMKDRIKAFLDSSFHYYVEEINEKIVGYCYLHN